MTALAVELLACLDSGLAMIDKTTQICHSLYIPKFVAGTADWSFSGHFIKMAVPSVF